MSKSSPCFFTTPRGQASIKLCSVLKATKSLKGTVGEAVHVCARILLKYTLNVDEENKVGGKLTVWFRSLLSLLGEPT